MVKVLVVDDNADSVYLLRQLLQGHGYAVEEAHHGAEALAMARQQPPDIVVSDLLMPEMDGYTLLRQWKTDPALRHLPFVVYTATYIDPGDEQLALEMGADAFLVKPADPDAFVTALQGVLAKAALGELAPPPVSATYAEATLAPYNAMLVRKLEKRTHQLDAAAVDRERALRALNDSEQRFRALLEHSLDMILQTAPGGSVLWANAGALQAFGLNQAQMLKARREDLIDLSDPRAAAVFSECTAKGWARSEITAIRSDGSRFPVEFSSVLYHDSAGHECCNVTLRDLSAQKSAEVALKRSQAYLAARQAAMDAHLLLSTTDADGNISFVNDRVCEVSGYARDELIGRSHRLFKSGVHPPQFYESMWQTLTSGRVWKGEVCNRAKDGSLYWVEATIMPLADVDGGPPQFVSMHTDISERKRAEAQQRILESQLREVQKLQAVGTLAGGIAHDFNNIIAAIIGFAALARDPAAPAAKVRDFLAQIQTAGERARDIVRRILSFSRPQPERLLDLVLQDAVGEALAIVRATLPRGVLLETRLPDEAVHVLADSTQLQQVLLNLYTNAWHAMQGQAGRVETGLDTRRFVLADADRPADLPPGGYAHLWVSDTGCGMDPALRARIFEPFFTTKPMGEGSGLGLSAVHGIIGAHQGAISVDSEPGRGSCFHVYLPRVEPAAAPSPEEPPASLFGQDFEQHHVLYVDDDEPMALLAELMLAHAGYRVTIFDDARLALAAVQRQPMAFDLVVTDFNMPSMSGLELTRGIRGVRADLPVIISSGYIDAALRAGAAELGVKALLNKERSVEDLVRLVRHALAEA